MTGPTEKRSVINGVEIFSESFGDPSNPALLLVMGAMASGVWWPDGLCQKLADAGRFVIRYDHRDTGRSQCFEPGTLNYTVEDLADDTLGVLDAWKVKRAHFAGMSLGGYLSQLAALKYPERVLSLTLIASQPLSTPNETSTEISPEILAFHSQAATLDWSNQPAVIDYRVGGWKLLSGSARPFEEPLIREIATRDVKTARNLQSSFNHALLPTDTSAAKWLDRLDQLRQPTLVIHGTEDSVLPYSNGVALAEGIPGAKLVTLEGVGHELHRLDWGTITDAIVQHTSSL